MQQPYNAINVVRAYFDKIQEPVRQLRAKFQEYRTDIPKVHNYLKAKGWFLSLLSNQGLPEDDLKNLSRIIDAQEENDIDKFMSDMIHLQLDNILATLQSISPHREGILADAFQAHNDELYTLSIPVLFIQVDGISREILQAMFGIDKGFYGRRNQDVQNLSQAINNYINDNPDKGVFMREILETLTEVGTVSINFDAMDTLRTDHPEYNYLINRNEVLHGIDVTYAEEIKSLKVISCLGYLVDVYNYA